MGILLFFTNYSYNPCLGVKLVGPYLLALFVYIKKKYLQANIITNYFKCILT